MTEDKWAFEKLEQRVNALSVQMQLLSTELLSTLTIMKETLDFVAALQDAVILILRLSGKDAQVIHADQSSRQIEHAENLTLVDQQQST